MQPSVEAVPSGAKGPEISSLLEKAQDLIIQCDYNLAGRFVDRILQRSPHHSEAKEMLGVVQLETGDLEGARLVGALGTLCVLRVLLIVCTRSDIPIPAASQSVCAEPTTTCCTSIPSPAERRRPANSPTALSCRGRSAYRSTQRKRTRLKCCACGG